jgi:hypothetical protein
MAKKATKFFVGAVIGPWTLEKEIQKKQGNRKYLRKDENFYSKFEWVDNPEDPYLWMDKHKKWYCQKVGDKERIYL